MYLFCSCWVVRLRSLIGLSQVKQGTLAVSCAVSLQAICPVGGAWTWLSPRKIAWVYYTLANVFTMDLGCGMQQCEFKVKRCILVPFLCSLVWGGWLESPATGQHVNGGVTSSNDFYSVSEQKIILHQFIESQCKRCGFFSAPIDLQKTILGPTPTVQIEKTARCQSLGLHCHELWRWLFPYVKNIKKRHHTRLNLGKYWQPKKPINKCQGVPFPCGTGNIFSIPSLFCYL